MQTNSEAINPQANYTDRETTAAYEVNADFYVYALLRGQRN
jgi:hypothetical protein